MADRPILIRGAKPENGKRSIVNRSEWDLHRTLPPCDHKHTTYYFTEGEDQVECGKCGVRLDPMFVIVQIAQQDSIHVRNTKEHRAWAAAYEQKKKTKCQHCGRITRVNAPERALVIAMKLADK
jgi:hypothetical protein